MNEITFLRYTSLDSTNQKLYQLATENYPEFTVVSTIEQTRGKGQRGTTWESSAYKNITLSFLLRFEDLKVENSFLISLWFSVYLHQFLSSCQIPTYIKWPNDFIINRKKIGGILIENKVQNSRVIFSVIGLGLNVYQTNFNGLPKASSIYLENQKFSKPLKIFEEELINCIYKQRNQLNIQNWESLLNYYYQYLLGYKKVNTFLMNNNYINGIIMGITNEGKLKIKLENSTEIRNFDIKEISLLY